MKPNEEIMQFLKDNPTFYLATVDGYLPRVRPIGFAMWYKDHLCLAIGKHKAAYKQLLDNTNLEICAANERGEWLRVQGTANFDNSPEALAAAFQVMPQLADMYNEESGLQAGHRLPGPPFGQAVLDVRRGQGHHELLIACLLAAVSLHAPEQSRVSVKQFQSRQ